MTFKEQCETVIAELQAAIVQVREAMKAQALLDRLRGVKAEPAQRATVTRRRRRAGRLGFKADGLQAEIIRFVAAKPMGRAEVSAIAANFPGVDPATVRSAVALAEKAHRLVRVSRGVYRVGSRAPKRVVNAGQPKAAFRPIGEPQPEAPSAANGSEDRLTGKRLLLQLLQAVDGDDVTTGNVVAYFARHGKSASSAYVALSEATGEGLLARVGTGQYRFTGRAGVPTEGAAGATA